MKQVKHLIQKSIKTNVLNYFHFEWLIRKTICLINKRPISFLGSLRSLKPDEIPESISPEKLIKGYEAPSVNVVPYVQPAEDDFQVGHVGNDELREQYAKMTKVREALIANYHSDFLANLIYQAVDKPDRYKPVVHKTIRPGDIVLLEDKYLKRYCYPLGRIISVDINRQGEVTAAKVKKADTNEIVYRHSTTLIPLLSNEMLQPSIEEVSPSTCTVPRVSEPPEQQFGRNPTRKAASRCRERFRQWGGEGTI